MHLWVPSSTAGTSPRFRELRLPPSAPVTTIPKPLPSLNPNKTNTPPSPHSRPARLPHATLYACPGPSPQPSKPHVSRMRKNPPAPAPPPVNSKPASTPSSTASPPSSPSSPSKAPKTSKPSATASPRLRPPKHLPALPHHPARHPRLAHSAVTASGNWPSGATAQADHS